MEGTWNAPAPPPPVANPPPPAQEGYAVIDRNKKWPQWPIDPESEVESDDDEVTEDGEGEEKDETPLFPLAPTEIAIPGRIPMQIPPNFIGGRPVIVPYRYDLVIPPSKDSYPNTSSMERKAKLLQMMKHLTIESVPRTSTSFNCYDLRDANYNGKILFENVRYLVIPHRTVDRLTTWFDLLASAKKQHPFTYFLRGQVNSAHVCIAAIPDDEFPSAPYYLDRWVDDLPKMTSLQVQERDDDFGNEHPNSRDGRLETLVSYLNQGWTRITSFTCHGILRTFLPSVQTGHHRYFFSDLPVEVCDATSARTEDILKCIHNAPRVPLWEIIDVGRNTSLNDEEEPLEEDVSEKAIKRYVWNEEGSWDQFRLCQTTRLLGDFRHIQLGITTEAMNKVSFRSTKLDEVEGCVCCGTTQGSSAGLIRDDQYVI